FDDFVAETDLQITKPENQTYGLSVSSDDLIVETYSNTLNAFHEFGRLFLTQNRSEHLKNELLAPLLKEKKLLEGKISKTEKSLKMQKNKEDYQQLGDLLMANLHQIKRNTEQVKLLNFYTNQEVSIALKRDLSPQDNAARYYKKAKNVHLDFQHRRGLLTTYNADILKVEAQIEQVAETLSHKELLKLTKTATQEKSATELKKTMPYRSFEKEGFEIWLGKNSKGNDEVLHRGKSNDMWLHAREVAGSHVLIRNPEGKTIPKTVLEYAAIIAAANSKNKSNTLVPVIYTERKYVRKFKGALPGQVKVDRESVVMVDPREFLS
ncbi:MAG: putative ribosome quality control (RQC) complex YloA/Tae2 family protein, partial [Bacteroidia bacterium]